MKTVTEIEQYTTLSEGDKPPIFVETYRYDKSCQIVTIRCGEMSFSVHASDLQKAIDRAVG